MNRLEHLSRVTFLAVAGLTLASGCGGNDTTIIAFESKLSLSDDSIDLGEVIIGESASHVLAVINAGQADLDIESIEVVDGGSDYSLELGEMTVEPGLATEVGITLIPTTLGDLSRDLLIVSDDPDEPEKLVPITALAVDIPEPDIDLSTLEVDFGAVDAATVAPFQAVEIVNVGRADLEINTISVTGSGAFSLSSTGAFTVPPEGGSNTLIVEYAPTVSTGDSATVTITSNDPDEPSLTIDLIGNGGGSANYPEALVDCPVAVQPPQVLTFDGSGSTDPAGGSLSYLWTLVDAPNGFENQLFDPDAGEDTAPVADQANLLVDLAGDYEVQLQVQNEEEVLSAPAVCRFAAVPENAIHVELVWDEVAADLDLHLAQEGFELFQTPGDVSWCNPNPEWGSSTETVDNPYLELDSEEGPGPENIYLPSPADGDYYIRVHHYTDNGANDVLATVKIWLDGELFTTRSMRIDTNRVWDVGYIRWPSGVFVPLTDEPEIHQGARRCPPE